jgi:hypothetical protein
MERLTQKLASDRKKRAAVLVYFDGIGSTLFEHGGMSEFGRDSD